MLTKQMKLAAILAATMGSGALAQTATVVETPDGQTAILPEAAVESDGVSPVATAAPSDYPIFNQDMNDQTIADTLLAQGFGDIYILRDGSLMTVTASRDGDDIKLLYNLVEGRLIEVNGERILTEEERTLDSSADNAAGLDSGTAGADEATGDGMTDDGATPDETADDAATDDGATDDGATDDGATDDGAADDGGAGDSAGDSGADSGADGSSGGEGGSESGGTNG